MAGERTIGMIVRTRPLTETSLIVHWITADLGRLSTVAKGARRPNSPFRGKLDLFFAAEFSFVRSRRSDLHTLREINVRETNTDLRKDIGYLQQASYFVALMEQATETETPVPEIFQLINDAITYLSKTPPQPRSVFAFEAKMLHELGLAPDLEGTKLSPGGKQILMRLVDLDWKALDALKLSNGQVEELSRFLFDFIIFHLSRIPSSRGAALNAH